MYGHNRTVYRIGTRFDRLQIIGEGKIRQVAGNLTFAYLCRCSCGVEKLIMPGNLKAGQRSCGCLARELLRARATKHGHKAGGKSSKEYSAWNSMRDRCLNPETHNYHCYGGRGIKICEQWSDFTVFLRDMGYPPENSGWFSVGRKDNDGDYTPDNCRWEIPKEQGQNRRPQFHRYVTAFGETKNVAQWLDDPRCKATKAALFQRLNRGVPAEEAITMAPMTQKESSAKSRSVRWNGHRARKAAGQPPVV